MTTVSERQWCAVRHSLRTSAERFAELVRAAPSPAAMVTAEWSVAEMTAHVAAIASMYSGRLANRGAAPPGSPMAGLVPTVTVDTVAEYNEATLRQFTERRPEVLTNQLLTDVDDILRFAELLPADLPVPWLGDARLPVAGVLAHMLNELLVHGHDIGTALRLPWTIPTTDAALFVDLFLFNVLASPGRLVPSATQYPDRMVSVELLSKHTRPAKVVLHQRKVSVEPPDGQCDVRLRFDPPGLDLMLFGRLSRARAALTGKVLVTGRRPWLLPGFLRVVRLPTNSVPRGHSE
ncbi:maleylpyruvate isomerase N-terminal domain-containing protein [Nocardia sp. NPDC006044]|uniref:maleylpyruvate isomerase N-terminal domain-containing protein n=1 Tax=Nocardia sp. NPDC006044 TaxID=3364306 RepID=UPI0036BED15C